MPTPDPTPPPDWRVPAQRALQLAVDDDWPSAAAAIIELHATCGDEGVARGMLAWIDTAIAKSGIRKPTGMAMQLAFREEGTGRIDTNADDVRPSAVWAGRLFAARIAGDEGTYLALVRAVPEGEAGGWLMELLATCALAANGEAFAFVAPAGGIRG